MLMQRPKISPQLPLLVDIKILLVPEKHNSPRCYQSCNIIFLRIAKVGEIDAFNFSTDFGVVVADGRCRC